MPEKKNKKCYPLSFPIVGGQDSTRALQSTRFRIQGGWSEPDKRTNGRTNERTEILVSNIG